MFYKFTTAYHSVTVRYSMNEDGGDKVTTDNEDQMTTVGGGESSQYQPLTISTMEGSHIYKEVQTSADSTT